jgi:hypothetical protein
VKKGDLAGIRFRDERSGIPGRWLADARPAAHVLG